MSETPAAEEAVLWRIAQVVKFSGLSRPFIYSLMRTGEFPKQVYITRGSVAWRASEVRAWVDNLKHTKPEEPPN